MEEKKRDELALLRRERKFVVVSYDISDDKRRTRVMKTLKDFGRHVQYSVFECDLKDAAYTQLRARLARHVVDKEDSIRFYFLDADAIGRIEVIGGRAVRLEEEVVWIGGERGRSGG